MKVILNDISDLKGKIVRGYLLLEEGRRLHLILEDDSWVDLYAVGDCCSSSWFEIPTGDEAVLGAEILDIEFVDLDKVIERDEYDVLKHYSLKIRTTKGYFDIELRNSSNGYYGGMIALNEDDQYGNTEYPRDTEHESL